MSDDVVNIEVNGVPVQARRGQMIIEVTDAMSVYVPRFCYHPKLSIAANCRMCLVEVERAPKPLPACATPVMEGMKVFTRSPRAVAAQKATMEFLLINHPLDCPICDQGGECDLQDQSLMYGRAGSRYGENKRAVEDKYMGPLIKTVMTRCIQCTRCVRFATEIAGVPEVGAIGRGEDMEITTYLEQSMTSELSGNVIDLCPVGALTSRPYAFNARPWELTKTETIDVMDALGANIRVDSRSGAVLRIMPRIHEGVNEEWISDKTRFVWDGLGRQRLDKPYVRKGGKLTAIGWDEALTVAAEKLSGDASKIGVIAGDLNDAEGLKAAKDLFDALGVKSLDCRQDGSKLGGGVREGYLFNATIAGIDKADAILFIGANPRVDAPVLNARIRQRWLNGQLDVAMIGEAVDLTYPYEHLGSGPDAIGALAKKRSGFIKTLKDAKNPIIILGNAATARADGAQVLRAAGELAKAAGVVREGWNGFSVLHTAASRVAGLDMGFLPGEGGRDTVAILEAAGKGQLDTVVLLGADEIDTGKLGKAFVIYVGHHGDAGAMRADLILPSAAYTEKPGLYVNTEGRAQLAERAVFPKGEAKEDWAIFRALSARLNKTLPYDSLNALRAKLIEEIESFGQIDHAPGAEGAGSFDPSTLGEAGEVSSEPFVSPVKDFYLTNAIARASKTMAECSAAAKAARATLQAAE